MAKYKLTKDAVTGEELPFILLGEGAYITCAIERAKDDLKRWAEEKRWEYEAETGIDYDNRELL